MSKYYPGIEKVKRRDFYTDFDVTENFFKEDDLYEIGMVYFIIRSSEDLIFNEYLKTTMFKRYSNEVLDEMSNNKKKVDKQFAEVKQYVAEFVKTILNELRHRCLYVYDSFIGGALNTKNVHRHVQSLATIIPLFLFATDFYGKQADICWDREPAYIDKSMTDPLKYVIVRNIPQQDPQSNDCGMYACAFVKVLSHGLFDISTNMFNATNHRMRYGAVL
ncbi:hypothetical protein CQW23_21198 [Capsicum baccatum]|uniref:Ubiquitin-like protease family profile domain-containing protein n=1 Tax=Capsicum baccatum TaxID=33114 RepID=A0A2G2VXC4_CAPBA|nr:hypothetical protein CQW23_21198 [Capsicum baccatum]